MGNPGWVRKQDWFVASEAATTIITFASTTALPEGATGPNAYGPLIDDVAVGEFELAFPVVAHQWWVPAQSGWGAAILQQGDTLFICCFVYGTDGNGWTSPLMLTAYEVTRNSFGLTMRMAGMGFGCEVTIRMAGVLQ